MKLEECMNLKNGTAVWFNLGNGWRQNARFRKMRKVTVFPTMTFSDLMSGQFDVSKGKDKWVAVVEFVNAKGKITTEGISPRKLHKTLH